jgi:cation:H+ antiporter
MDTLPWLTLQLLLCAAAMARAGYVLSESADTLADAYGWGRGWVGLALLATVTSLPELASGISAVALVGAPNLAVGNALGACVFNLFFLVIVDALQPRQPIYRHASPSHLLSAAFGIVLLGLATLGLLAGARTPAFLNLGLTRPSRAPTSSLRTGPRNNFATCYLCRNSKQGLDRFEIKPSKPTSAHRAIALSSAKDIRR